MGLLHSKKGTDHNIIHKHKISTESDHVNIISYFSQTCTDGNESPTLVFEFPFSEDVSPAPTMHQEEDHSNVLIDSDHIFKSNSLQRRIESKENVNLKSLEQLSDVSSDISTLDNPNLSDRSNPHITSPPDSPTFDHLKFNMNSFDEQLIDKGSPVIEKYLTLPARRSKKRSETFSPTIDDNSTNHIRSLLYSTKFKYKQPNLSKSTGSIRGYEMWPCHNNQSLFMPSYPVNQKMIQNFLIIQKVGSGKYSEVFKVCEDETDECFALKKLQKSQIITSGMIHQVQDEIHVLLKLGQHPFILSLVQCWQAKGFLYQLIPYVTHGDLYSLWTNEKPFPMHCVKYATAEIVIALDFIHGKKILYRDLKMENILLSDTGHVLLSDFGLSKHVGRLERSYTICGTLPYMAPEVISGNGYSYECDWWSAGIVCVAMATGKFPFSVVGDHKSMLDEIKRNILELPKFSNDTVIKDVIRKLLNYRPWHRFSKLSEVEELKIFSDIDFKQVLQSKSGPFLQYFE